MTAPRVGFVGVGNMGWPMARRDRAEPASRSRCSTPIRARARRFASETGSAGAADGAALAGAADIVVTMLPTGKIVRDALLGEGGIARSLASQRGGHRHELVRPDRHAGARPALAELGVVLVDAPVSGGVPRAKEARSPS